MNDRYLLQRRNRLLGEKAPLFYDAPVHMVKGQGVWLEDEAGGRYLDVYNNVPNVGHCHPKVVAALAKQAGVLNIHTRYLHETIVEYGEKLTSMFDDSLSMLFFTCTGSEANEIALRMARISTGKNGIICSNATYHGNTAAVYELGTVFNKGEPGSPNVKAVDFPCSFRPLNDLSGEALANAYADQVKRAIEQLEAEGTGFAGMMICPIFLPEVPAGYMEKISRYVRDAGGVLIFDEVQASFGRTGNMWGYESVGVVPDIVTLGKPMGNGHPLAAAVCRPDLGNEFREKVMYFNTFGGNPVSCAVGMAVLDVIIEDGLVENACRTGRYLKKRLGSLADKYPLIGDVRGKGLIFAVELISDPDTLQPASKQAHQVVNMMKEQGVLISKIGKYDNILKMRPPICFNQEHADILLANLDRAFSRIPN